MFLGLGVGAQIVRNSDLRANKEVKNASVAYVFLQH